MIEILVIVTCEVQTTHYTTYIIMYMNYINSHAHTMYIVYINILSLCPVVWMVGILS